MPPLRVPESLGHKLDNKRNTDFIRVIEVPKHRALFARASALARNIGQYRTVNFDGTGDAWVTGWYENPDLATGSRRVFYGLKDEPSRGYRHVTLSVKIQEPHPTNHDAYIEEEADLVGFNIAASYEYYGTVLNTERGVGDLTVHELEGFPPAINSDSDLFQDVIDTLDFIERASASIT
jgi:hypothetical protein